MSSETTGDTTHGELRLRGCLERLENIARKMGSDDIELEDALALHAEGVELLDRADRILEQAKLQVDRVTRKTKE